MLDSYGKFIKIDLSLKDTNYANLMEKIRTKPSWR